MGKTRVQLEIDTTGPFPAQVTGRITAQVTLEDGRVGTSKITARHTNGVEAVTGGDILTAINRATEAAENATGPASVDSFTRYAPDSVDYGQGAQSALAAMDENWKRLKQIDQDQQNKGELVGRYITHPIADGNAVYQITNLNGAQATIEVCRGLGDDWTIPAWGPKAVIDRATAEELVTRRDAMTAIFGRP